MLERTRQTIFWFLTAPALLYMTLVGLMLGIVIQHNHRFRDED